MSTRSCPLFEMEGFDAVTERQEVSSERLVGRGARVKTYNKRRNAEEDQVEQAVQMKYVKSGLLGTLRRLRKEITSLLILGEMSCIQQKLNLYEEIWIKFVKAHETFIALLVTDAEKEKAEMIYDEEFREKINLDSAIKQLDKIQDGSNLSQRSSRKGKSASSASSSRHSGKSVKSLKEKMALGKLNIEHFKKQQEISRQLSELNFAQEIMEAEMKAEKAFISYSIYEEETGAGDWHEKSLLGKCEEFKPHILENMHPVSGNIFVEDPVKFSDYVRRDIEPNPAMHKLVMDIPQDVFAEEKKDPLFTVKESKLPWDLQCIKQPEQSKDKIMHFQVVPDEEKGPEYGKFMKSQEAQSSVSKKEQVRQVTNNDNGEQVIKALSQVINTPKIEYMHFDGNPINFVSFMHNFETCLEGDCYDNSRNLQFLIQHCTGRAREAIQSCVNLPVSEGYHIAKETLKENFGLPHVIAKAHLEKLEELPQLKNAGGPALLEFARHLEVADRTLKGMGPEYVSDLNHVNTLRELSKKLPFFLRGKWAEHAEKIIMSGAKPNFFERQGYTCE